MIIESQSEVKVIFSHLIAISIEVLYNLDYVMSDKYFAH